MNSTLSPFQGLDDSGGRFTQGGTAFALGYYLSLRWSFSLLNE